jgi:lipid-A-disaccharide synthase-like uncharacterized protein
MRVRWALSVMAAALAVVAPAVAQEAPPDTPVPAVESSLRLRLRPVPADTRRVFLESDAEGNRWYALLKTDGTIERLTPDELAARLDEENRHRTLLFSLFNITHSAGIAWVVMGLLGQVLFTGRMVLQWLVSERHKRSVVPVGFWWMSLAGASMLLVYFIWRRDIVGVLGQSTGWIIYVRNLWLIYRERWRTAA